MGEQTRRETREARNKRSEEVINKFFKTSNISAKKLRGIEVFIELFSKKANSKHVGKIIEIDKNLNLTLKCKEERKEKVLIINSRVIKNISSQLINEE